MSDNKGKDGELRFVIAASAVGLRENDLDIERHSVTNQADMGVDLSIKGKAKSLINMCESAAGKALPELREILGNSEGRVTARVDVKTTPAKMNILHVNKFADDVRKHPGIALHILAGGSGMTRTAQAKWNEVQAAVMKDGKAFVHMTNEDVARMANDHSVEMQSSLSGPLGPDAGPHREG